MVDAHIDASNGLRSAKPASLVWRSLYAHGRGTRGPARRSRRTTLIQSAVADRHVRGADDRDDERDAQQRVGEQAVVDRDPQVVAEGADAFGYDVLEHAQPGLDPDEPGDRGDAGLGERELQELRRRAATRCTAMHTAAATPLSANADTISWRASWSSPIMSAADARRRSDCGQPELRDQRDGGEDADRERVGAEAALGEHPRREHRRREEQRGAERVRDRTTSPGPAARGCGRRRPVRDGRRRRQRVGSPSDSEMSEVGRRSVSEGQGYHPPRHAPQRRFERSRRRDARGSGDRDRAASALRPRERHDAASRRPPRRPARHRSSGCW